MTDNCIPSKTRDSNIELFRIVAMMLIIAHHYVVNSGLAGMIDTPTPTLNTIFLQCFGFGGKLGINCFTLITGYYMVDKAQDTLKTFRLWLEWQLYSLVFVIIFYITGYAKLSAKEIIMTFLPITYGANTGYIGSMLCLCLLIPFLYLLIGAMSQRYYLRLLATLLFINTVIPTFSLWNVTFGFVEWLCCIYLIGAYLRLYGEKLLHKRAIGLVVSRIMRKLVCSL